MKRFWPRILSTFSTFAVGLVAASILRILPPPTINVQQPCTAAEVKAELPPAPESAPPADAIKQTPPAEPRPHVALQFSNHSLSEKAEGFYENAADYPQLTVMTTAEAGRFNRHVEDLITRRIKETRRHGREIIRGLQREAEPARVVGGLTTSYVILFASQDFISLRFRHSYFGTLHPIDSFESVNYDLKAGRALRLGDIFEPQAKYLPALSMSSRVRLLESLEASVYWLDGTAPTEKNFAAWNLTPDGLVISFADYQVGPYAVGAPSVTIPLAEMRGLLKSRWRRPQALPH